MLVKMTSKCCFGASFRISVALIVIACLHLEHVKGSCLSYGHSCWGAHGKRAGPPGRIAPADVPGPVQFKPQQQPDQSNPLPAALTAAERWALVHVFPEKNAYYPFSRLTHPSPPAAGASFLFTDDIGSSAADSPPIAMESTNGATGRLADASNDPQTLSSTEQDLLLGDERSLVVPKAFSNGRRRDHRHKKKTLAASRTRFGGLDDSYEDNVSTGGILALNDDDIGQMLLLNAAAAAAATISDKDVSIVDSQFNRKPFNGYTKNSLPLNA